MNARHRRCSSLALAVALLGTAACAAGDDDAASTTTPTTAATTVPPTTAATTTAATTTAATTTTTSTTTTGTVPASTEPPPTSAPTEADVASTALIVLDDFVEGWVAGPRAGDDDEQDARTIALIAACAGVDEALIGDQVMGDSKVKSPEFSSPDGTFTVEHTVGLAPDSATAETSLTQIGVPELPDCYAEAIAGIFAEDAAATDPSVSLPAGLEVGTVTVERVDPSELAIAGEVVWYHVTVPLTFEGETIEQHGDVLFLRSGEALARLFLSGLGAPFPTADIGPIVQLADAKLATVA